MATKKTTKKTTKKKFPDWRIDGEYIESCNCDVSCPCLISAQAHNTIMPDYVNCDLVLTFIIDKGHYEKVDLAGGKFVICARTPGIMCLDNWITAYYIDARNDEQKEALTKIVTGQVGGPLAGIANLTASNLGVKYVEIEYDRSDPLKRHSSIPDIMETTINAKIGMHDGKPIVYENAHDLAYIVTQAYGVDVRYSDHLLTIENGGRNAFFGRIVWEPDSPIGMKY